MSDQKKFRIPQGMIEAAMQQFKVSGYLAPHKVVEMVLEGGIQWLAENPLVPTPEEAYRIERDFMMANGSDPHATVKSYAHGMVEWQRRMFLQPPNEPKYPYELAAIQMKHFGANPADWVRSLAEEAYNLGRNSSK